MVRLEEQAIRDQRDSRSSSPISSSLKASPRSLSSTTRAGMPSSSKCVSPLCATRDRSRPRAPRRGAGWRRSRLRSRATAVGDRLLPPRARTRPTRGAPWARPPSPSSRLPHGLGSTRRGPLASGRRPFPPAKIGIASRVMPVQTFPFSVRAVRLGDRRRRDAGTRRRLLIWTSKGPRRAVLPCRARARSSAGERSPHTREVAGSIPAAPTRKPACGPRGRSRTRRPSSRRSTHPIDPRSCR